LIVPEEPEWFALNATPWEILMLHELIRWLHSMTGNRSGIRAVEIALAKTFGWLWPAVNTLHGVERASAYGVLACFITGANYMYSGTSFTSQLPDTMIMVAPLISLLIAFGWIALGWAIYRLSRTAAIVGLLAYIATRSEFLLHKWSRSGRLDEWDLAMSGLLALWLLNSLRGAFSYQKLKRTRAISPGNSAPASA
jgi:hypothetical protein